jgi:DNA invertase Pin-like site-specific DNA recombinase
VAKRISHQAGTVKLAIRQCAGRKKKKKKKKKKGSAKRGQIKLKVVVSFTPGGGSPGRQERLIQLRRRPTAEPAGLS